MENMAFDWQLDEFTVYCRSRQLREKTLVPHDQMLLLFEHRSRKCVKIVAVDMLHESR